MFRRKPAAEDLAVVLRRLGRLRAGVAADGWVPASEERTDPAPEMRPVDDRQVAETDAASVSRGGGFGRRLPGRLSGAFVDPGRRGVAVLATLALLGAIGGVWFFARATPAAGTTGFTPAPRVGASASRAGAARTSAPSGGASWPAASLIAAAPSAAVEVVDVVGKVVMPGVVSLPAGSRIRDAIAAAGGALPGVDLTALDLASRLVDGEEIFVGIPPPGGSSAQSAGGVVEGGGSAGGTGDAATGGAPQVVDLNAATEGELQTLPGVGPVLAQRILDWRSQHGRFASVAQLQQVSGIGPSKYAALASRVRV